MSHWNTRGLRGSAFEDTLNMTNEQYRKEGLALIQKIPTPIKPIEIDHERRTISLAYFEQKSTVDYIGIMGGIPICFDAKECGKKSLPVEVLKEYYYKEGGRSSIPYSAFSRELLVEDKGGAYLHYLPAALKYAKMEARGVFKTDTCQDEEKSV